MLNSLIEEKLYSHENMKSLSVGDQSTAIRAFTEVIEDFRRENPYAAIDSILDTATEG